MDVACLVRCGGDRPRRRAAGPGRGRPVAEGVGGGLRGGRRRSGRAGPRRAVRRRAAAQPGHATGTRRGRTHLPCDPAGAGAGRPGPWPARPSGSGLPDPRRRRRPVRRQYRRAAAGLAGRDEHRSWRSARESGHRAGGGPVYIVPALTYDRLAPVRGLLALSAWPLEVRLVAPASHRVDMLHMVDRLAAALAEAGTRPGARTWNSCCGAWPAPSPGAVEGSTWTSTGTVRGRRRAGADQ